MDSSDHYLQPLPIDQYLAQIVEALKTNSNLVLTAAPGAGKTTRLPAAIVKSKILSPSNSVTVMLEPRRLAARAAAQRIAGEQKWSVGKEVGYQVRYENRTTNTTSLQILTEGIFAHRMQSNPELNGVGCLILDEFHERSSQTDVALALARELQELSRPDLKIIVMSATLETAKLSEFLGNCPVIKVPGLLHPVETVWQRNPQLLVTQQEFYKTAGEAVRNALSGHSPSNGNILVFLPGAGEIAALRREISSYCEKQNILVQELHGSLSLEQQSDVLQISEKRKVILATNIAESSLTVPGVATVIDTGLAKVLRQEGSHFPRLTLSRISKFSAVQRAGRAGREMKGYNYRLWNKQDEASMPDAEVPELLRSDLTDTVLMLSRLGVTDAKTFSWFESPSEKSLDAAKLTLLRLKAINSAGQITETGKKLARWPIHPRLASLIEKSIELGCVELGARLAALLSEKDPFDSSSLGSHAHADSDVLARLQMLDRQMPESIRRAGNQLLQLGRSNEPSRPQTRIQTRSIEENVQLLLLSAFSDRIAWRRKENDLRAKLITGEGIRLHESSLTKKSRLFFALEAMPPRMLSGSSNELLIVKASPVSAELLKSEFADEIKRIKRTTLDENTGQALTEEFLAFGELPLEEPKKRGATQDEAAELLPQVIVEKWDVIINQNADAKRWLERLDFARLHLAELSLPEIDDDFKKEVAESLAMGKKHLSDVQKKDLSQYLGFKLNSEQKRIFEKEVPLGFTIPSGRFVKVDYSATGQPTIEARLQEFFGWLDSPVIANGKVKIRVQLLGPNYRPVQVTSDLKGFWTSSYQEVRKELRARYPKHDWPENPLLSTAKQRK